MNEFSPRYFSLGDGALTVELGNEISAEINKSVIRLLRYFEINPFPGLVDSVPAFASLTLFYDPVTVRRHFSSFPTAFDAVKFLAEKAFDDLPAAPAEEERIIKIPVRFDGEFAPDLESLAAAHNLSPDEVVEIFVSGTYRVYMLGFLPGFAYMGTVDERIATPRKPTPRLYVPAGSVGIAGRQTGIYPLGSPGGWQIIGRTDRKPFTPEADSPCIFQPGDLVKFYRV